MADYLDNYDLDEDPNSIKLRESGPLNSSPYVRIVLDNSDNSTPSDEEKLRRQRELERRAQLERRAAEAERQKKARKKQRKQEKPEKRAPEPSLRVIIEKEPEPDPFDEYAYDDDLYDSFEQNFEPVDERAASKADAKRSASEHSEALRASRRVGDVRASSLSELERSPVQSFDKNRMYRIDEPELTAPPSVVLPSSRTEERSNRIDRPSKIVPIQTSNRVEDNSGFIKRPWSEAAFNDHASNTQKSASAVSSQGVQQQRTSGSRTSQGKIESRPFPSSAQTQTRPVPQVAAQAGDAYSSNLGMGSWKRNAAETAMREQTPKISQQSGTVNIKLTPVSSTVDPRRTQTRSQNVANSANMANINAAAGAANFNAGNLNVSRDALNRMGAPLASAQRTPVSTMGSSPLIDPKAATESIMFEEPPVSIADGMKNADKRRRRRRSIIIVIVVLIVAAIGGAVFLSASGIVDFQHMFSSSSSSSSSAQSSAQSSSSRSSSASASSSQAAQDLSGTVIYEYTATTSDGVSYKVNDTVAYNSEGLCQTTTMQLQFPDEASCAAFLENLQRDYGSDYRLNSQDGAGASVTINISSLEFDRDQYEDALRYSVEDLMVLKK